MQAINTNNRNRAKSLTFERVLSTIVASINTIMASTDNPNLFFIFCNNPLQTEVSTYILSFVEKQPISHFKQSSLLEYPSLFVRSKSRRISTIKVVEQNVVALLCDFTAAHLLKEPLQSTSMRASSWRIKYPRLKYTGFNNILHVTNYLSG